MADMATTSSRVRLLAVLPAVVVLGLAVSPHARQAPAPNQASQALVKDAVAGVRNFTKVDDTIALGGAISAEGYAALKQAGFTSVVSLRAATEQGVDLAAEEKAAAAAGLKFISLPFVTAKPDTTKIDEFLKLAADPASQPMMLHCVSGGRASIFWAVKRVMIDGWPVEKAMNELPELSKNASQALKTVGLDYLKAHGKVRP
jgi:uncharacterized protein (TIGR01244 family)